MQFVILKVRNRDGESRYVAAVKIKDSQGHTKQDVSRKAMLSLCGRFKLLEEEMTEALKKADKRFEESGEADSSQSSEDTNTELEFRTEE